MHLMCHVRILTALFRTIQDYDEPYRVGQEVYVKGPRGTDINPYKIHEVLGNGQYKLSRNNEVVRRVYAENSLQIHL